MTQQTFVLGDAIEELKHLKDKSVRLILVDLPYGTTKNKWDILINLNLLWKEYKRVLMEDGCVLAFSQSPFNITLANSNLNWYRYEIIWEKTSATGHLNAKKMPMKAHENILVFYNKLPVYNPIKTTGHTRKVSTADHKRNSKKTTNYGSHELTTYDSTERYPRDVIKFKTDKQKSSFHPTQKPVPLLEYLIKTYSNEGDLVVDNTCGSGSTGVACKLTNRNCFMVDNDPNMEEVVKLRLEQIGL